MESADGRVSFMLDVDNTLLDNDALKEYLAERLRSILGVAGAGRFWALYEEVRRERDVVDLPLTAQRYAEASGDTAHGGAIEELLDSVPFDRFVYSHAFATLRHLATLGTVGILSDGDQVFQRRKIDRSGLAAAVNGRVLIYVHKEDNLDEVERRWPADHRVMIDDKARILQALSRLLSANLTTVHILQGHYARDPLPAGFTPDITAQSIGELRRLAVSYEQLAFSCRLDAQVLDTPDPADTLLADS